MRNLSLAITLSSFLLTYAFDGTILLASSSCYTNYDLQQSQVAYIENGRQPDANGITHVTFGDPSGYTDPAISSAFAVWNNLSSSTGVEFDPVQSGQHLDIQVSYVSNSGCISTAQQNGSISYGSDFSGILKGATAPPRKDAILSFEHEIGHLLGLKDNPAGSQSGIMDQSTGCIPGNKGYAWDATPPTTNDASSVQSCLTQAKKLCVRCHR